MVVLVVRVVGEVGVGGCVYALGGVVGRGE